MNLGNFNFSEKVIFCEKGEENYFPLKLKKNKKRDGPDKFSRLSFQQTKIRLRLDDDFNICKFIGRGKFAEVFSAISKIDGKKYAIKSISKKGKITRDMLNEAKSLAFFTKHFGANIVRYYSAWTEGSTLYISVN